MLPNKTLNERGVMLITMADERLRSPPGCPLLLCQNGRIMVKTQLVPGWEFSGWWVEVDQGYPRTMKPYGKGGLSQHVLAIKTADLAVEYFEGNMETLT